MFFFQFIFFTFKQNISFTVGLILIKSLTVDKVFSYVAVYFKLILCTVILSVATKILIIIMFFNYYSNLTSLSVLKPKFN